MQINHLNSIFDNTTVTHFWHHTPPELHIAVIIALAAHDQPPGKSE